MRLSEDATKRREGAMFLFPGVFGAFWRLTPRPSLCMSDGRDHTHGCLGPGLFLPKPVQHGA